MLQGWQKWHWLTPFSLLKDSKMPVPCRLEWGKLGGVSITLVWLLVALWPTSSTSYWAWSPSRWLPWSGKPLLPGYTPSCGYPILEHPSEQYKHLLYSREYLAGSLVPDPESRLARSIFWWRNREQKFTPRLLWVPLPLAVCVLQGFPLG